MLVTSTKLFNVYLFYFTILVAVLRDSNYASVGSPFPDLSFSLYCFIPLFFYFHIILLNFIISVLCPLPVFSKVAILPRTPFSFMCSPPFWNPTSLFSSHHPLSSFISALILTVPPLKISQLSISFHLLLGKIFLVIYILFFWPNFDLYFLFFFYGIFELMP